MIGVFVQLNENDQAPLGYVIGERGCWLWVGPRCPKGYGLFHLPGRKLKKAHRYMYERLKGPIPVGLVLDHFACDTPSCINPDHLRPVTSRENTLRSTKTLAAKQAAQTHCKRGHLLEGDNLRKTDAGHRRCRICRNLRENAAYYRRKLAA
jgi:hypothetical protein